MNRKFKCIIISTILIVTCSFNFSGNKKNLPIYSVERKEKEVALTFNGSWGYDYTNEILTILEAENIKATFFLVGAFVTRNPEKVKAMYEYGHEIGNHSDTHPHNICALNDNQIYSEIYDCDEKIMNITKKEVDLFRSPSGNYNDKVIDIANECGKYVIQWDADSIDWRNDGREIEYKRVMNKIREGTIIQFHLEGKYTVRNIQRIIKELKSKGYEFKTVGELIYKNNYYINLEGRQIPKE